MRYNVHGGKLVTCPSCTGRHFGVYKFHDEDGEPSAEVVFCLWCGKVIWIERLTIRPWTVEDGKDVKRLVDMYVGLYNDKGLIVQSPKGAVALLQNANMPVSIDIRPGDFVVTSYDLDDPCDSRINYIGPSEAIARLVARDIDTNPAYGVNHFSKTFRAVPAPEPWGVEAEEVSPAPADWTWLVDIELTDVFHIMSSELAHKAWKDREK